MCVRSYPGPVEGDRSGECDGVRDSQEALVGLLLNVATRALPLKGPFGLACRKADILFSTSMGEVT